VVLETRKGFGVEERVECVIAGGEADGGLQDEGEEGEGRYK
jgi:hypothetical protein